MNEKLRVLVILLAAIVAGLAFWYMSRPPAPPAETAPAAPVLTTVPPTKSGQPLMLEVGSSAGPADLMMAAVMLALREGFGNRLEVQFENVDRDPSLKEKYGVKVIPTQIFYDPSGKEIGRHEGYASEQKILDQLKTLGYDLLAEPQHGSTPENSPAGDEGV